MLREALSQMKKMICVVVRPSLKMERLRLFCGPYKVVISIPVSLPQLVSIPVNHGWSVRLWPDRWVVRICLVPEHFDSPPQWSMTG